MNEHRKDPEYIPKPKVKRMYDVTMLIRGEQFYHDETYQMEAESAAHAIDQVIDWLREHTNTNEWEDFEFKAVHERNRRKRR